MKKYLVVIGGPTAIGKTSMGITLAKYLNTEIISADSRQFYRELNIGTAKPTKQELESVKHYFVNNLSIKDDYTAGDFEREVLSFLDKYFETNNTMIMVGGSGLFVRAVTQGLDEFPDVPKELRIELNPRLQTEGMEGLQEELRRLDPDTYNQIDSQNSQRVIRALEVCIASGKPMSYYRNKKKAERDFEVINIGLNTDRPVLYDRINNRVDLMINAGLVEEARENVAYRTLNALKTVGYQELFQFFDDEITIETAVDLIKRNTRRFAKRQITWFKKEQGIRWFEPNDLEGIINYIEEVKSV